MSEISNRIDAVMVVSNSKSVGGIQVMLTGRPFLQKYMGIKMIRETFLSKIAINDDCLHTGRQVICIWIEISVERPVGSYVQARIQDCWMQDIMPGPVDRLEETFFDVMRTTYWASVLSFPLMETSASFPP